jgi:ketosteroid isomerase-like protein
MNQGLTEATAGLVSAVERGDATAAAALYADDAKLLAPASPLVAGRGQIEAYWRTGIALGITRIELETLGLEIAKAEVVALEVGRYALGVQAGDRGHLVYRGKYIALHRREADGSWRRAVDVFNPDQPHSRPSSAERNSLIATTSSLNDSKKGTTMRNINTRMGAFAVSLLSALLIATGASAGTCTSSCFEAEAVTIGAGSTAEAIGQAIDAPSSGGTADRSLPAIRRPGERGPGLWTY